MHYILDQHNIVMPEPDLQKWANWMSSSWGDEESYKHPRFVKKTDVGDMTVSTVFLGVDYNFESFGDPIVFETMVFRAMKETGCQEVVGFNGHDETIGSLLWGDNRRYSLYAHAIAGHDETVEELQAALKKAEERASNLLYGSLNVEETN